MLKPITIALALTLLAPTANSTQPFDEEISYELLMETKPLEGLKYSSKEHECLARNVYYESRGQPLKGQQAVAQVVINRSNSVKFPNTMCGVTYQKAQFSWVGMKLPAPRGEQWEVAKDIAANALASGVALANFPALYFHNTSVRPGWNRKFVAKIANHYFYM